MIFQSVDTKSRKLQPLKYPKVPNQNPNTKLKKHSLEQVRVGVVELFAHALGCAATHARRLVAVFFEGLFMMGMYLYVRVEV